MTDFVHLHVHSEFSLLDGLARIPDLVARAVELGQPAIALTDHGAMYGVMPFYRAAKQSNIKPIIGIETYITNSSLDDRNPREPRYHLVLLAENQTGYQNLLKLASISQLQGFYYQPRINHQILAEHSQGLIATSACLAGEIPRLINQGQLNQAQQQLEWYLALFGRDRFFIELQEHSIPELTSVNKTLLEWGPRYNLRYIATNDSHYVYKEDAKAHDLLLCIQTGKVASEPKRMRMSDDSYYLKSGDEMAQLFGHVPGALANTRLIADRCEVNLDSKEYHLPHFQVPEDYSAESYLRHLCEKGLYQRYGERADSSEVRSRLEHELEIIHNMGFDAYFLIVWDLCMAARRRDIWWNVRGSAAGSIVAYTLEITMIDPLETGLIFERFLNPGRVSMPDIDLDFPDDRRMELIEYTLEKYGSDQVAQIITFGTMGARAAVRDVGRAMDVPLPEVDRIAKLIPAIPGKPVSIQQALEQVPELREAAKTDYIRELLENAASLEGIARHASTHAAGVIVSDRPLVEYCPLNRPTKGADDNALGAVTQWPMEVVESIGLLKVDFLGLSTLTLMRRACDLIQERHGIEYNLNNIPLEDPKAFELLASGNVMGVFQVEGSGFRRVLAEMRPSTYRHIIAVLALYRPGPLEHIPSYIRRMHGEEPVSYRHPMLEPILSETFGICVSGDALVFDAKSGQRYRLDELQDRVGEFTIQGVDDDWQMSSGRVTHWVHNGRKPVLKVTLRNGACIKTTADHRFLTEAGWRPLNELAIGDHVATPPTLATQNNRYDHTQAVAQAPSLEQTERRLRLDWQEIISIQAAGVEDVYDITVAGLHNFVANNILVHNCVYQEQIMFTAMQLGNYTASEADFLRKTVAKKKGQELLKQRERFVSGALENDIDKDTADAIFDDWEAFARYGFPKGHAADYAVITCQTAFLKANYPVEYMTALLTVERNNTDKIGLLLAECRKMGIQVLPPDINISEMDFIIQESDDEQPTIRFGLGAIKNVGQGPIHTILEARRADGSFKNLDDFCRRVDVRQVNRRALESFIKVGALGPLGQRSQLLAAIEPIMSHSATIHKAKDVGQMSLFGAATGLTFSAEESIFGALPETAEIPRKELLGWEKELIGAYVSEHPLQKLTVELENTITHFTGDLADTLDGQRVCVAGMVTYVRRHTTKKGAPMAFVGIEDIQGAVEIVVFPRTWKQNQNMWEIDKVVIVHGRLDSRGREPKIICESVRDKINSYHPADAPQTKVIPAKPTVSSPTAPQPKNPSSPSLHQAKRRQHLIVIVKRTGNYDQDVALLRSLRELLTEFQGNDSFRFHVLGGANGGLELTFPNDRTQYCAGLERELVSMLGPDCLKVE